MGHRVQRVGNGALSSPVADRTPRAFSWFSTIQLVGFSMIACCSCTSASESLNAMHHDPTLSISAQMNHQRNAFTSEYNDAILAVLDTHTVSLTNAAGVAYANDTATLERLKLAAEWYKPYITTGEEAFAP